MRISPRISGPSESSKSEKGLFMSKTIALGCALGLVLLSPVAASMLLQGAGPSTDAGKTWTHLAALRDTAMIANVEIDPKNPNRVFVAALGHPYGPNAERGIFRSTDGGASFQKVLYKNEYVSANDVRIDPNDPNI